jgi:hypothetical protein
LRHTIGSPWVDEGTTVTFATYFHRLTKAETADIKRVFSVKRKVEREGESINWFIFSKKKNMIFWETSSRFILQSLGLRLPMYIYMPL